MGLLRRFALLVVPLSVLLTGCATGQPLEDPYEITSGNRPPRIELVVRNMNFLDARLYALRQSGRRLIGEVGGKQDAQFELEWPISEPLRIEIDMVAGPRCVTESLQVDRGDILELLIESVFSNTRGCR